MDLIAMTVISLVAGYLSSMNVWADKIDHVRLHLNDFYMVSLMTCWMVILMMMLPGHHSEHRTFIVVILLVSIIVLYYLIRTQTFIDDRQFLNGMIPHHSMAILMSRRIRERTSNPLIKGLADDIIRSQTGEIKIMNDYLINHFEPS